MFFFALLTFIFAQCFLTVKAQTPTSFYSDLHNCRQTNKPKIEADGYVGLCGGHAGYILELVEGDLRQSVNVYTPAKRKFELAFWNVTSAFSHVGAKAEWRRRSGKPQALIIRLNASENVSDPTIYTSYLVISKITKTQICITDVVKPAADQNQQARRLADQSHLKPCKFAD